MQTFDSCTPSLTRLMGIARANHREIWDRTHCSEVLNRLMGRPIFTKADRVVCKDKDRLDIRQGSETYSRAHIVRERLERSAERDHTAIQCHTVHRGTHTMLTDAIVNI